MPDYSNRQKLKYFDFCMENRLLSQDLFDEHLAYLKSVGEDERGSDESIIQAAIHEYQDDDVDIDDDPIVSHADGHAWVSAWVRVEIGE